MKTLLHICCAPCANMPIEVLRGDGLEVTGYWYNPNIHPFTEYRARRNCLREYAQEISLPLIGRYQLKNACTAITALEALREKGWKITKENIYDGITYNELHKCFRKCNFDFRV